MPLHTKYSSVFYPKQGYSPRNPAHIPKMRIVKLSSNHLIHGSTSTFTSCPNSMVVSSFVLVWFAFLFSETLIETFSHIQILDGFKASDVHVTWGPFLGGFFHLGCCQCSSMLELVSILHLFHCYEKHITTGALQST